MKKIIVLLTIISFATNVASQKMLTRNGEVKFEATVPAALEQVAAVNNAVSCLFDLATGDFVALALVKAFKFKIPLMEEHFNENYIESSKYPKATFKGKFVNFDANKLLNNKNIYDLEGELTLHGITNKIKTKIAMTKKDNKLLVAANLTLKLKDYKIDVPSVVKNKLSENIAMKINFILENK